MTRERWGILAVLAFVLTMAWGGASPVFGAHGGENDEARAASAAGLSKIDGEDVIVEILVAVQPGEDPGGAARAALRRAYPNAQPIESAEFETNELLWDVFSDNDPGNDQVTVNYNGNDVPANLSDLDHRGTWQASMAAWNDVSTSVFAFADGGDTGRCASLVQECRGPQKFDGNNDVMWIDIKDPSVLGVTWYGLSTDEFDMGLDNRNFTWHIGDADAIPSGAFDVQTVWTHEKGHGLGLGHSNVDGAVMEPYYEGVRRVLPQDDIDGVTFLYSGGGAPPPPPPPESVGGELTVNVSTGKGVYANREVVLITANVKDSEGVGVSGSAVHMTVETASGRLLGCDPTTDSSGEAACTYKVNAKRDGIGTYTVNADASMAGYDPGSNSTIFEVK